jgi:hypothetical protein
MEKHCTKCKQMLDVSNFWKNGKYYKSRCKPCTKEDLAPYLLANKEYIANRLKAYKEKHKDTVLKNGREYQNTYRKEKKYKVNALNRLRKYQKMQRTPSWLTLDDKWFMEEVYHLAQLRTKMLGFEWHVDHIIPIKGENVSGLHVPNNLRVIPAKENLSKNNKFIESEL